MPDYAADDAVSIAARVKELAAERERLNCGACQRGGIIYGKDGKPRFRLVGLI